MKKFILTFLLFSACAFANDLSDDSPPSDEANYWYASAGAVFVVPKLAIGHRYQNGKIGGDVSLTYALVSSGLQYNFLFFPKPNIKKEWYLGLSGGAHILMSDNDSRKLIPSVGILSGFQFMTKRHFHFIELKFGGPLNYDAWTDSSLPVPFPSITYGVSF